MSQNYYDVTTNAIVSNNLAFIYILFFFWFLGHVFCLYESKTFAKENLAQVSKSKYSGTKK